MKKADLDECFASSSSTHDKHIGLRVPIDIHAKYQELKERGNKKKIIERVKSAVMAEIEALYDHAKARGA